MHFDVISHEQVDDYWDESCPGGRTERFLHCKNDLSMHFVQYNYRHSFILLSPQAQGAPDISQPAENQG